MGVIGVVEVDGVGDRSDRTPQTIGRPHFESSDLGDRFISAIVLSVNCKGNGRSNRVEEPCGVDIGCHLVGIDAKTEVARV